VKYDPATLQTDSGARRLYARIAQAAAAVCPENHNPLFVSPPIEMCRNQAIERAVANVHNPRLAAVYLSATKHG
jgi:UrcA family protein